MENIAIDYKYRLKKLQNKIRREGWDAYITTRQAVLSWMLGTFAPWRTAIIIPSEGDPTALIWNKDASRIRAETSFKWNLKDWGLNENFTEAIVDQIKAANLADGKIALDLGSPVSQQIAPGLLLASEYVDLRQKLPSAYLMNAVPVIEEMLAVKDDSEISLLRKAAQIADIGMAAARNSIKPGVTENHIAGVVEKAIREEGSEWSWSTTLGTEVGSGERTAYYYGVTQPATEKIIRDGELVIVDLHPMYHLYLADLAGNFYVGSNPDRKIVELQDAWEKTVETLLKEIKPGAVIDDVVQKGFQVIEDKGLGKWGIKAFGHGLGTCARIAPYLVPKNNNIFKENMVMALGAHIYIPEIGGMRLELPTIVHSDHAEPLSKWPSKLHYIN